ncbi:MAG: aspartate aminotransferase family protein [Anaerolineae bacterium]|nr:aspartate aminotransferase family protein [Anaerolineae bacterium]
MMQTTNNAISNEQNYVLQTYVRPDFVLVRGNGINLYDEDGKAYQDWVAGIAVNSLGYNDSGVAQAMQEQAATGVLHVSNLYHTEPHARLAKQLVENSFADRVYFCNSGAEANEGALKFARRVAFNSEATDKTDIVTFSGAFHGRTMGALAVTPKDKYQTPFKPMMPGVTVAEFNNIDSAKETITAKTAAVIVEPLQGEGGIHPATNEFLRALRQLCDDHQAMLIFDEIQCGLGRTGTLWAHEVSGVTPDMMTLAKPLANGLPIGAILVTQAVADNIRPGDHGSTFAGGLLVTNVASHVVERIRQPEFLAHVQEVGEYLMERLEEVNSPLIREVRGRGLMAAIELTIEAPSVIKKGYEQGILLVNAGPNTIRFVPPLIIEKSDVDSLIDKLTTILEHVNE